jgi:hypothetical protein
MTAHRLTGKLEVFLKQARTNALILYANLGIFVVLGRVVGQPSPDYHNLGKIRVGE